MSDQPEPTRDYHDVPFPEGTQPATDCTCDIDTVCAVHGGPSVCSAHQKRIEGCPQCYPKPASEWTSESVQELVDGHTDMFTAIADAHKAALAAERKSKNLMTQDALNLKKQLAAEMGKVQRLEKLLRSMPKSFGITEEDLK